MTKANRHDLRGGDSPLPIIFLSGKLESEQIAIMEGFGGALAAIVRDGSANPGAIECMTKGLVLMVSLIGVESDSSGCSGPAWCASRIVFPGGAEVLTIEAPHRSQNWTLRCHEDGVPFAGEWGCAGDWPCLVEFRLAGSGSKRALQLSRGGEEQSCTLPADFDLEWADPPARLALFSPVGETVAALQEGMAALLAKSEASRNALPGDSTKPVAAEEVSSSTAKADPSASCPHCGSEVSPDAKFCGKCGGRIEHQKQAKPNTCPACGGTVGSNARFCGSCGHALGSTLETVDPSD